MGVLTTEEKRKTAEKYFDTVYRLAVSQTKSKDFADDVVQDVFLRFVKTDTDFKSEEHIKAWLIRVTINCSKSFFTSSWFKKTEGITEDIPFETPEEHDLFTVVQTLPQKYRAVIHLFYYEDLPIAEISKCLNEKEATVKTRLRRAREMLKEKLKGDYDFV